MALRADDVLLLRRFPYGESSLVVWGLSRRHGRLHLMAKGAYRPKSSTCGLLDLFDTLELEWSHSPHRELQTLRAGRIGRRRRELSRSLPAYRAGLTVLELCGYAAQVDQPVPGLFHAAEVALDALDSADPPEAVLVAFELRYLGELGLAPALDRCAACGRPERSRGRAVFSAGAGGRLCPPCGREARQSGRRVGTLPAGILDAARDILAGGAGAAPREPQRLERVRDFVARFVQFHLESRPRSYQNFLAVPNRNRPRAAAR